jgi:type IV pilus assembly protein PilY1
MLHAFNAGFYDSINSRFDVGDDIPGDDIPSYSTAIPALGEELWAYIPYNLLPHLRWLKDTNYEHVYYVDLKPRVIDAQIFTADTDHPGGWGTVLIGGMRFGGGSMTLSEVDVDYDWDGDTVIEAGESRTFTSSYFAFDITNPEVPPTLLWEFTDANLGFTTSYPAVVSVDRTTTPDTWAIAFGSGPTDYDGTSSQTASTYVVNLKTGVLIGSALSTSTGNAFMGDSISVDLDISDSQCSEGTCTYAPDVAYIGNSEGRLYRIRDTTTSFAGTVSLFLDVGSTKAIASAPSASQDNDGRLWLYFGTGRFYHENDKANTDTQSLVGVKEPLTNYADWTSLSYEEVDVTNLLDVTGYTVFEGGYVDINGDLVSDMTFDTLVDDIEQTTSDTDTPKHYDGWILNITNGERSMAKPTVLGGIVTFSTFEPDDEECAFEGESFLYAPYYKTGTAYYEPIIGYGDDTMTVGGEDFKETARKMSLGEGVAATPSLHMGEQEGVKAFVQSSTGEIEIINEINLPEAFRSKPLLWLQPGD